MNLMVTPHDIFKKTYENSNYITENMVYTRFYLFKKNV